MGQLRFITGGESHGAALTAIIDGLPAGLQLSRAELDAQLARRQRGYGRGGRMKIETDRVLVLSGLRFGETIGAPLTLQVVNRDFVNWTDRMDPFGAPSGERITAVRPGHADLAGVLKYDRRDARDILERSSARETTMRVAVGAVCRRRCGRRCGGHSCRRYRSDQLRRFELLRRGSGGAHERAHRRGKTGRGYARRHL